MNPQQEHVMMVGPWGWFGYAIAAVIGLLFARLWWSSRPTELRAMQKALREARQYIQVLEKERDEAKRENAAMRVQIEQLQGHYNEMDKAVARQRTQLTELSKQLGEEKQRRKEQEEKSDEYYKRLMQLETKFGLN